MSFVDTGSLLSGCIIQHGTTDDNNYFPGNDVTTIRPADPWAQSTASNDSSLEDCGFKPLVLTTTQRSLRERDAVSAEVKAVAVKGTWFLNNMRTSVAQGHYAGPAAWFGSDIRTLNSARHAVGLGQLEVFGVMFCTFYII